MKSYILLIGTLFFVIISLFFPNYLKQQITNESPINNENQRSIYHHSLEPCVNHYHSQQQQNNKKEHLINNRFLKDLCATKICGRMNEVCWEVYCRMLYERDHQSSSSLIIGNSENWINNCKYDILHSAI